MRGTGVGLTAGPAAVAGPAVPLARWAAAGLGGVTAVLLVANPATRWWARERREDGHEVAPTVPLLFDVNTEATIPTWWSSLLLAAVALAALAVAVAGRVAGARHPWRWVALAAVFAAMSLDEGVALHERLEAVVGATVDVSPTGVLRHPWVLAGAVLAVGLVAAVAWSVARLPARRRWWVAGALAVYLGGALGLESASGWVLDTWGDDLAYAAVTWGEEAAEMVGALLLCCALLTTLDVRAAGGQLRVGLAPDVLAAATPAPAAAPAAASATGPAPTGQNRRSVSGSMPRRAS